jgi:hypothetical protein
METPNIIANDSKNFSTELFAQKSPYPIVLKVVIPKYQTFISESIDETNPSSPG